MSLVRRRLGELLPAPRFRVSGHGPSRGQRPATADSMPSWFERLAGLERRRVPPHIFAVEAGRLLYGRFTGDASPPELIEFHERPLAEGLWPDGPLGGPARDPAALAEVVASLVSVASARPAEASLVVPDAWLRLAFTELNELPSPGEERDEVLRWKLKGLVPFRIEELRIEAAEVATPAAQDTRRILLGFGIERLLSQLEEVFAGAGVQVGQLVSSGLALGSLAGALVHDGGITALAYVGTHGYGLAFQRQDALLFHRAKQRGGDADTVVQVRRDLLLTRSFLEESFPDLDLDELLLLAPASEQDRWMQWLDDAFGRVPRALGPQDLPLGASSPPAHWLDVAPLMGAALGEF